MKEIRTRRVSNNKETKNQFDKKVTNANKLALEKIDSIDKRSPFPYNFTEDDLSSSSFSSSSDNLTNNQLETLRRLENNNILPQNVNNQYGNTSFVNSVTDDSIVRF